MLVQSDTDWELILVSDGRNTEADDLIYGYVADFPEKIKYFVMDHKGQWGHHARNYGLTYASKELVVMSGHDNYYVPSFVSEVNRLKNEADFIYWNMVHSYNQYKLFTTDLALGHLDMGSFAVRTDLARKVGGLNPEKLEADWDYAEAVLNRGVRVEKIDRVLFVHN